MEWNNLSRWDFFYRTLRMLQDTLTFSDLLAVISDALHERFVPCLGWGYLITWIDHSGGGGGCWSFDLTDTSLLLTLRKSSLQSNNVPKITLLPLKNLVSSPVLYTSPKNNRGWDKQVLKVVFMTQIFGGTHIFKELEGSVEQAGR